MNQDGKHPFAMSAEGYQQLSRLDRHQAALQRTFDRAMKELRDLQAEPTEETTDSTDSTDYGEQQNEPTGEEVESMLTPAALRIPAGTCASPPPSPR